MARHLAAPGTRVRVTGGFAPPKDESTEDRRRYERGITRAVSRSQRVGEQIARLADPQRFDPATQLRSGEAVLVEVAKGSPDVVFVEFYKPR